MADARGAGRAARPVVTRVIGAGVVGAPVPLRAGENLVLDRRRVADAVNQLPVLVARRLLEQVAAALRLHQRIAVQLAEVRRDDGVLRRPQLRERPVEPRPLADAIARVDGGLPGARLRAQVRVPRFAARADSRRELLAVRVGAREAAKVAALADADAGD